MLLERIEVGVCLVWGSGGPVRGWAPDACHAEFGIGRLKQQTTSVTVATRRPLSLCVETEGANDETSRLESLLVAVLYR